MEDAYRGLQREGVECDQLAAHPLRGGQGAGGAGLTGSDRGDERDGGGEIDEEVARGGVRPLEVVEEEYAAADSCPHPGEDVQRVGIRAYCRPEEAGEGGVRFRRHRGQPPGFDEGEARPPDGVAYQGRLAGADLP